MSTETIEASAGTGAATEGQTEQPGQQTAAPAQPQTDATSADDQSQASEEDNGLSDEQKTIRKLQRRIDRLTAKRGGTERENELLRQEIANLQRQQHQAASGTGEGNEGQGEGPKRTLTEADVERMAQQRAQELHRQTTIAGRVSRVLEAGSKLQGFNEAVNAVAEVVPFTDRQGRPTPFIEAVLDADDPAALLKHLGDNPDEAEDFADLTPSQLGRRLAKLEDKLKQAPKKTSAAPTPLKPVGGSTAGAEPDPSKMTFAEFKAWREKQIEARRRR